MFSRHRQAFLDHMQEGDLALFPGAELVTLGLAFAYLCAGELLPLLAVPELGFERRLLVQLQHVLALHGLSAFLNLYK